MKGLDTKKFLYICRMKKAIIFARISSSKQDDERQIIELQQYADNNDYKVIKIFREKESASRSATKDRVVFKQMEHFIKLNPVHSVLFWEATRITRREDDFHNFSRICIDLNINIFVYLGNINTIKDGKKDLSSSIAIGIHIAIGEDEANRLSERTKSGRMNRIKQGKGLSTKIYGFTNNENGFCVPDKNQALGVKKAFELVANGHGCHSTAIILNEDKEIEKSTFTTSTINSMIRSKAHIGIRSYAGEEVKIDPIVSNELWEKANSEINRKLNFTGNKTKHVNLVQGLIKCGHCGSSMYQVKKQRSNQYKCKNNLHKKTCKTRNINRDWLYNDVLKPLVDKYAKLSMEEDFKNKLKEAIVENDSKIEYFKKAIVKNERELNNLLNQRLNTSSSRMVDMIKQKETSLDEGFNYLNEQLNECKSRKLELDQTAKQPIQHFSDDPEIYQKQLQKVIDVILVGEKFLTVQLFNFPIYTTLIPSGAELRALNMRKKKNKNAKGFHSLDWDKLPESDFTEDIE